MSRWIREFNWSTTPLGPMQAWSDTLLASINLMLAAVVPMQVFWGEQMTTFYNDAMLPALEGKHPGALGQPCHVVWAEAWPVVKDQLQAVLDRGTPCLFENVFLPLLQNGVLQDMYWNYSYSAVYESDGSIAGILDISQNVTQAVMAQRKLIETEKLTAVGRLAASIAHEINNPLESVTNLMYLATGSKDADEIHGYLNIAERELRRVSAISRQTLRFYKQSTHPRRVSAEDLFESVLLIYQGRFVNSHVNVRLRMHAVQHVECFDGEIRQVLSNLISNAIDSMHPAGGKLLLRSRDAIDPVTGAAGIVLTIADTGTGMSAAVMHRIFEAFFTTKGIGGTGLGMFVSKEILDRHHGKLHVRSSQQPGHSGTVFTLFLPLDAVSRQKHTPSSSS